MSQNIFILVAANIGAVIMPWMVFYQQSSVVEKKLLLNDLPAARLDTAFGAAVTQIIMAAVLIATAATLGNITQLAHSIPCNKSPKRLRRTLAKQLANSYLVSDYRARLLWRLLW